MIGAVVTVAASAELMGVAAMQHGGIGGNDDSNNGNDGSSNDVAMMKVAAVKWRWRQILGR